MKTERKMFLGADKGTFRKAEELRNNMTEAEIKLWEFLKERPLGHKFRRQYPISYYIADFYCHSLKLVIEVDGNIHLDSEIGANDIERQKNLEAQEIKFLRFTNDDVENNFNDVINKIEQYISQNTSL
jgi:cyclase